MQAKGRAKISSDCVYDNSLLVIAVDTSDGRSKLLFVHVTHIINAPHDFSLFFVSALGKMRKKITH